MAERDDVTGLPGTLALGWWFLMRPISLRRRLRALGIEDLDARPWRLWRGSAVERAYLGRLAVWLFVGTPIIALALSGGAILTVNPVNLIGVAGGVGFGVLFGVAVGVGVGVAAGVVVGVAFGVALGVESGVTLGVGSGVGLGVAVDVAPLVAIGVTDGVAISVASSAIVGTAKDIALSMVIGVVVGVAVGVNVDMAGGVVVGVSSVAVTLRLPFSVIELPIQLVAGTWQRWVGQITLRWSPVLHHELSSLPLPFLAWQIVDTAPRDPALARRALAACEIAPGQRRAGRIALARLRANELGRLAKARAFQATIDLRGDWLPGPDAADPTLAAFRATARYLLAAELTLLPTQRLQQLLSARDRLHGLDNALLGARGPEQRAYREPLLVWQRLVDGWITETEAEAAQVLANPFRAGEPLEPEFGREVFRGREGRITRIEGILGDPTRAASLALIGPRRCGKTSLLKMLPLKLPDTQVVFFDVQAQPMDRPAAFVEALVREARDQARRERGLELPALAVTQPADDQALALLGDWIGRLEIGAGIDRVLLCIDEFERLADLYPGERRALLQLLGLIRATIQHRRRVRVLVSGAAPFEELDADWNDHFVNLRELAIGHLDRPTVIDLLTRPTADFPPDALPPPVAEAVWRRTLGQPYLTQLYGLLMVERLNATDRRQAEPADCAAVEPELLDQAGYYLRHLIQSAPPPARQVLDRLARGEPVDLATIDGPIRRWLRRRWLVTENGRLGIPLLGRFLLSLD